MCLPNLSCSAWRHLGVSFHLLLSLDPLVTTHNNSILQLVQTMVSAPALFVIAEDQGTTRALYSMKYSETVKNIEEDLNVLLGSDL